MKTLKLLIYLFFICCSSLYAQEKYKFGNVTKEELVMQEYSFDKKASAIILDEYIKVTYGRNIMLPNYKRRHMSGVLEVYNRDSLDYYTIITTIKRKIKILKPEGKQFEKVTIPFNTADALKPERIRTSFISASSYNLQNGEIKKKQNEEK